MVWRFAVMAVLLAIVGGGFYYYQQMRSTGMAAYFAAYRPPATPVAAVDAKLEDVPKYLQAIGSLAAVHQVTVTSEVGGLVTAITFEPGATVKAGDVLVQLDDRPEQADLRNYQAQARYAQLQLGRSKDLVSRQNAAQATVDLNQNQLDQATANIAKTQALIAQKQIEAPFSGRLGIRQADLGQYLNAGGAVVSLTDLDQLYVNLTLPEQNRSQLAIGQPVDISVDAYPGKLFRAKLTAIEPQINVEMRTIKLQATLDNPQHLLLPGMFANAKVVLPPDKGVVTVPATAVDYTLYGDSVFLIQADGKDDKGNPVLKVVRTFVKTGDRFDNRVVILTGVKHGDRVAASGQVKLNSGDIVTIGESNALATPSAPPIN
jgi:multidrug efflux system membrane fusion protein